MSPIQLVKSERGQDHVFLDGFTFRKAYYHATIGGWKWRCTNKNCSANMYLDNELSVIKDSSIKHNHSVLSRKRPYLKALGLVNKNTAEDVQQVKNVIINGLDQPISTEEMDEYVQKSKRRRTGTGTGVRRKRQKNQSSVEQNAASQGIQLSVDENEFPLDQCDSNTVFVNDFENHSQTAELINHLSTTNASITEEPVENFDPLTETFATTAFPAICDMSSKKEFVCVKSEPITVNDENDFDEDDDDDEDDDNCYLYEDVSLTRNFHVYHSGSSSKNSTSQRTRRQQKSRSNLLQGSIDLSHPIDTFFLAMAQSVKSLTPVNQIKAKLMITNLVTKLEMAEATMAIKSG